MTNNQSPDTSKKVAIIGMGPVGSILAMSFQEAGCQTIICVKDKIKMNVIRNEGFHFEGNINKKVNFENIVNNIADLQTHEPDIIIFALKSYQTKAVALELLKTFNKEKQVVVSAQNGIETENILAEVFGDANVLRMVINFAGNILSPNRVKYTFFIPPNYIASIDDSKTAFAEYIANALNKVQLTTTVLTSFEIIKKVWEKTILNSSLSALCGVGRMTMKEIMEIPDTVEIVQQVIEEAVEVAEAEKIKFEDDFIRKCIRYLKKAGHHYPSLAVDLMNNRQTEIDYFNGKIVAYGRKHYVRTSINLLFTNIVRGMSQKNANALINLTQLSLLNKLNDKSVKSISKNQPTFLGVDLGSAFMKFTVINSDDEIVFQTAIKTLNRDKVAFKHVLNAIHAEYNVEASCATGYGRKHFAEADFNKTEINCAAVGVSKYIDAAKCIIDIGGEDIKIIHCDENNSVENFYLNDKCAAGTGSFITEIAERADVSVADMSKLAQQSDYKKELNSFCTVFAKTEIMSWIFDGIPLPDIAKGIYLSITNRVAKMRLKSDTSIVMIGGVIANHPYLRDMLEKRLNVKISTIQNPQFTVSYGAAIMAKNYSLKKNEELIENK